MDRIERHDIINALGLAAVLLLMAFLLSTSARRLFATVKEGDGVISSEKNEEPDLVVTSTTSTTEPDEPEIEDVVLRVPAEVKVLVVNAARVSGIASQGTKILEPVGYQMLNPGNADSVPDSVIYFVEGYEADAAAVAVLLNMGEDATAPLPESVSFSPGDAHLVAVLGANQTLR